MQSYLHLKLAATTTAPAPIRIEFSPASTPPAPGLPGNTVGETLLQPSVDQKTLIVSLGEPSKWKADTFRQAGGAAARWLLQNKVEQAEIAGTNLSKFEMPDAISALFEGLLLGAFQFNKYKSEESSPVIPSIFLRTSEPKSFEKILLHAQVVCESVNLARLWGHEPANVINPLTLAERLTELATETGLKCTVLDEQALLEMGAGGLVNVGKGSATPSRLIILEYLGKPAGGAQEVEHHFSNTRAVAVDRGQLRRHFNC